MAINNKKPTHAALRQYQGYDLSSINIPLAAVW